jgi:hypothetical protein
MAELFVARGMGVLLMRGRQAEIMLVVCLVHVKGTAGEARGGSQRLNGSAMRAGLRANRRMRISSIDVFFVSVIGILPPLSNRFNFRRAFRWSRGELEGR